MIFLSGLIAKDEVIDISEMIKYKGKYDFTNNRW
jgi:hypothetical protein